MDSQPIGVGGEIEAYCTSCKTMKWHVVVAMVEDRPAKVECHGCHKQHVYRASEPGAPKPKSPGRARAAAVPARQSLADLEAKISAGERDARGYSPRERYAVDELVRHPSFGCGLVTALPGAQKMEVAFLGGKKLLVHDRA